MKSWITACHDRRFRKRFLVVLASVAIVLSFYSQFLLWVERRPGVILHDPLLSLLPSWNCSGVIFALLYLSLLWGITTLAVRPRALLQFGISYGIMVFFRICAMAVLPLDPPIGMIALSDPIGQFLQTSPHPLTRDLFFSGHTATMCLLFWNATNRIQARVFLISLLGIAAGVLLQKVHYSIDVLAAPFFSYAAYRLSVRLAS